MLYAKWGFWLQQRSCVSPCQLSLRPAWARPLLECPGAGLGCAQPALRRPRQRVLVSIGTWARLQQEPPPCWTQSYLVSLKLTWLFVFLVLPVIHEGWKQELTELL